MITITLPEWLVTVMAVALCVSVVLNLVDLWAKLRLAKLEKNGK